MSNNSVKIKDVDLKDKNGNKPPIIVIDYDPSWPLIFEEEKKLIVSVLNEKVQAIEHIGSTAVQGLGAKPTIDILVGIQSLSFAASCIEPLSSIGYEYVPEYEDELPERRYFRKGPRGIPNKRFHLHMVEHEGDFWKKHILFRDYLRIHKDISEQYYKLKKE